MWAPYIRVVGLWATHRGARGGSGAPAGRGRGRRGSGGAGRGKKQPAELAEKEEDDDGPAMSLDAIRETLAAVARRLEGEHNLAVMM